jgi:ATP-binding cassette, subfamily B, bacterial PglK
MEIVGKKSFFGTVRRSFQLLPGKSQALLIVISISQIFLGLLDLVGILILGSLGTLVTNPIASRSSSGFLKNELNFLRIHSQSEIYQIKFLLLISFSIFLIKSISGLVLSKYVFHFLARVQDKITLNLVSRLIEEDYGWIQTKDPHYLTNALFAGVSAFSLNALGQLILIIGEAALLVLLLAIFAYLNLIITIFTIVYIGIIIYVLNSVVGKKISVYNSAMLRKRMSAQIAIFSILKLFKEIRLSGTKEFFIEQTTKYTESHSQNLADDIWIQQLPKYVLEFAMLFGIGVTTIVTSSLNGKGHSIGLLAIFIAGAVRIFPSMLRIQGSIFSIRAAQPQALSALNLIEEFESNKKFIPKLFYQSNDTATKNLLELKNVSFKFPNSAESTIAEVSLVITKGTKVGLVGPSGAGKSTLVDLMQGLLLPSEGSILIEGVPASKWIIENPGKLAYVPQVPGIVDGSILENLTIGRIAPSTQELSSILSRSGILEFIEELPNNVGTIVGTEGYKLSGGQLQRLAIARALLSDPEFLVFDEATAALDAQTEEVILQMIQDLPESVTVLFIAHRLSSLKYLDEIIYLENGKILSIGSIDQVRKQVKDFDDQLKLMSL